MSIAPSPILGFELNESNAAPLDLSRKTVEELGFDPQGDSRFEDYIFDGRIRYGGYLEERSVYQRSDLFSGEEARSIHLGVDIWHEVGAAIYAPWEGTVIGVADNGEYGSYGPTLILRHELPSGTIHSLYGHLGRDVLGRWHKGDCIEQGALIAHIGSKEVNGGWLPHLHLQLIRDLEGEVSDYPGVCAKSRLDWYRQNCPNPCSFGLCPD